MNINLILLFCILDVKLLVGGEYEMKSQKYFLKWQCPESKDRITEKRLHLKKKLIKLKCYEFFVKETK